MIGLRDDLRYLYIIIDNSSLQSVFTALGAINASAFNAWCKHASRLENGSAFDFPISGRSHFIPSPGDYLALLGTLQNQPLRQIPKQSFGMLTVYSNSTRNTSLTPQTISRMVTLESL